MMTDDRVSTHIDKMLCFYAVLLGRMALVCNIAPVHHHGDPIDQRP